MLGRCENIDRRIKEPDLEPVDVLMLTLDADTYLERCLDSVYREIPVNKFIVVDGGSKDKTVQILNRYPRMQVHARPDIRTTGKGLEFMFSQATTRWVATIDADMELAPGWYDEMAKYKDRYDYFESKRIMHYEFYRDVPGSINMDQRSGAMGQLGRLDCFKNYHVDDDYMWRATDMLLRQVVEKDGYKFGKVSTTYHYHHTTDGSRYESDAEKRGSGLVFEKPKIEIRDKANWRKRQGDFRRAVVKYLDPDFLHPRRDVGLFAALMSLDMKWVRETNVKWYRLLSGYRRKTLLRGRPRVIARYTAEFMSTVRNAFKIYINNIRMS